MVKAIKYSLLVFLLLIVQDTPIYNTYPLYGVYMELEDTDIMLKIKDIIEAMGAESIPENLNTDEAADFLRVRPNTLAVWRTKSVGPRYARLGRKIIYTKADLKDFVQLNRRLYK